MRYICFSFYPLYFELESLEYCQWKKGPPWHKIPRTEVQKQQIVQLGSHTKVLYEYLRVFGCQSEEKFTFLLIKIKQPVNMMVFEMFTSDGDFMPLYNLPH